MPKPRPSPPFNNESDRVSGCSSIQCAVSDPLRPVNAKYLSKTLPLESIKAVFETLGGLP